MTNSFQLKPSVRTIVNGIKEKWGINITIKEIVDKWSEPQRHFHTAENHLAPMLDDIIELHKLGLDDESFEILMVSALFHDFVYDPKSDKNELNSTIEFLKLTDKKDGEKLMKVVEIIKMTKDHKHTNKLEELFSQFDLKVLSSDLKGLLKWEEQISKEYEFVNWKTYKSKRIELIQHFIDNRTELSVKINYTGLKDLIYMIEIKQPSIAIYAGSFQPFHRGHLNILQKAEKLFDKVIVAKGRNESKSIDDMEFYDEFNKLQNLFPTKEVMTYSGLLTEVLKAQEGKITLIRGLRNGYDLEAENTLIKIGRAHV